MHIGSFRQFATWFVNALSDAEVREALKDAAEFRKGPLPANPERRREQLIRGWTQFRGGPAARISQHFAAGQKSLLDELKETSLDEVRQMIDDLADQHGVKDVAFALVISGDKYRQQLGFELATRRGDEVKRPEEPEMSADPLELLGWVHQSLEKGVEVNLDAVGKALDELQHIVRARQEQAAQRTEAWESLEEVLGRCRGHGEAWNWLGLDEKVPLEAEPYESLDMDQLDAVLGWMEQLRDRLEETERYKGELARGFSQTAIQNLDSIHGTVDELASNITNLLSKKTPPPDDHGLTPPEIGGDEADEEGNAPGEERPAAAETLEDGLEAGDEGETKSEAAAAVARGQGGDAGPVGSETAPALERVAEDEPGPATPTVATEAYDVSGPDTIEDASAQSRGLHTEFGPKASPAAEAPTEQEVPVDTDGDVRREILETYFWKALGAADMPGAYWLALEWEARGREGGQELTSTGVESEAGVFPSWVMLAVYFGLQANLESVQAHDWLQQIILDHPRPIQELAAVSGLSESTCARVILLAAVRPTLVAPHTGAWGWFQEASEALRPEDRLQQIVSAVRDVARHDLPPQTLRNAFRAVLHEQRETPDLGATLQELRTWVDRTRQGRLMAHLGTRVLRNLVGRDSDIGRAVDSVLEGRQDAQKRVRRVLNGPLKSEDEIKTLAQTTSEELTRRGHKTISLQARALEQVSSRLVQLASLLATWLHFQQGQSPWDDDSHTVVAHLIRVTEETSGSLGSPELEGGVDWRPPWAAGGGVQPDVHDDQEPTDAISLGRFQGVAVDRFISLAVVRLGHLGYPEWERLLVLPALFAPEPPLDSNGALDLGAALTRPARVAMAVDQRRTVTQALGLHLQRHDYLAAQFLLDHLEEQDAASAGEQRQRFERARAASEGQLRERVEEVRARLEEATIEHGLTEEERAALDGRLLSIEDSTDKRIGLRLRELDEIRDDIERYRQFRRESLRVNITELRRDLETHYKASPAEDTAGKYLDQAERLVNEGDLALADEYLTHAEQALKLGEDSEWDHVHASAEEDPVAEFRRTMDSLITVLSDEEKEPGRPLIHGIAQREDFAGLSMKTVTGQAAKAAADALQAYHELKRTRKLQQRQLDVLVKVLEHIGFSMPTLRLIDGNRDRYHVEALMSDGSSSPIPEFGSKRNGRYDVVVIFGQPGQDVIAQTLNTYKVTRSHPIVLYVGRLTLRQRQDWSHYCRTEGLTALLVDELLLYFLATRRQHHLWAAVSCGVAWGYANPYEPQGPVPREMFKGRVSERRDMVEGRSSFIYGGRQFGKSVLLSVIERELHAPDRKSYAFYEDIRQIGKQGPAGQVWPRIRRALIGARLLDERSTEDPERLVRRLTDLLGENRHLRVAFLFDEADAFLDADQHSDFTEVHRLKRIVERSNWRFRVVFSGLHSVQRFERLTNQPFAHLGKPIVVGPLKPKAAVALVEEPLRALGFQFDRRETLLRILSYTNYHPALIQLFCKELVYLVRQGRDDPPYLITMKDVQTLYLRPQLRSELVKRFEWTLDLDDRYRALVYAMILAQKGDSDGYRREFAATELWGLAYERWPEGFNDEPDEAFRSYLEELSGLGILMRMPSARYRLRNGNVVRGLGAIDTIEERLERIARKSAPSEPDFRQLMFGFEQRQQRVYGPLTIGQASDLMSSESASAVVLGSQALRINQVPRVLQAVARQAAGTRSTAGTLVHVPADAADLGQVREYVSQQHRKVKAGPVIVYLKGDHPVLLGASVANTVRQLDAELRKGRSIDRGIVRLTVLLGPPQVYRWMQEQGRDPNSILAEHADIVILHRWPHAVVKATLADLELPATDDMTTRVLEVTGGWPLLLEWVVAQAQQRKGQGRDVSDLEKLIAGLESQLEQSGDGVRDKFLDALGLEAVKPGLALLRLVDDLDNVAEEQLVEAVEDLSDDVDLKRLSPQQVAALQATLRAIGVLDWYNGHLSVEPVVARLVLGKKAEV